MPCSSNDTSFCLTCGQLNLFGELILTCANCQEKDRKAILQEWDEENEVRETALLVCECCRACFDFPCNGSFYGFCRTSCQEVKCACDDPIDVLVPDDHPTNCLNHHGCPGCGEGKFRDGDELCPDCASEMERNEDRTEFQTRTPG